MPARAEPDVQVEVLGVGPAGAGEVAGPGGDTQVVLPRGRGPHRAGCPCPRRPRQARAWRRRRFPPRRHAPDRGASSSCSPSLRRAGGARRSARRRRRVDAHTGAERDHRLCLRQVVGFRSVQEHDADLLHTFLNRPLIVHGGTMHAAAALITAGWPRPRGGTDCAGVVWRRGRAKLGVTATRIACRSGAEESGEVVKGLCEPIGDIDGAGRYEQARAGTDAPAVDVWDGGWRRPRPSRTGPRPLAPGRTCARRR